jgi:hypothetical protein
LIQQFRSVVRHPTGKDLLFPGLRGQLQTLKLFDHRLKPLEAMEAGMGGKMLPREKKLDPPLSRDRFDFPPQARQGHAMNPFQDGPLTPLRCREIAQKIAPEDDPLGLESREDGLNL